jgi:hypothetical protein
MPSGDALTSHFPASRTQPPPTNPAARSTPTRIVPHDDHDDVLKARGARLDPQDRRARSDAMREFADEMREAMAHSRPLIPK